MIYFIKKWQHFLYRGYLLLIFFVNYKKRNLLKRQE